MELVDFGDLESSAFNGVQVRVLPWALKMARYASLAKRLDSKSGDSVGSTPTRATMEVLEMWEFKLAVNQSLYEISGSIPYTSTTCERGEIG